MVEYKDGKIWLEKLEIRDIIDIDVLQDFLDNFALGMNCAAVAVDLDGKEITKPSYYRDFCQKQIHMSQLGDKRCAECHNQMGEEATRLGKPYIGKCHAGLIDFAAPIIIEGFHFGTVLGGQILNQKPNIQEMRRTAQELGLNPDEVEKDAEKIDVVAERNIQAAAEVLYVVVNELAKTGYSRLEMEYLSNTMAENFLQISQVVENLTNSALAITDSQNELEQEIQGVNELTNEIGKIMESITQVAKKTKMIGLNASIEAARLGESGRGFTVVATEIQHLSENTTNTTSLVMNLNEKIEEKLQTTIANSHKTLSITEDQSAAMQELLATIQNSVELAEYIKKLFEK